VARSMITASPADKFGAGQTVPRSFLEWSKNFYNVGNRTYRMRTDAPR
jgi:hypothetical protein